MCRCSVIAWQQCAGGHKPRATKLFTLAPNIACWSLVWNLLHVILVGLTILKWLLDILIIKPTRFTDFSNLFWYKILHVSDRFTVHHQEYSTVYTAIGICHAVLDSWWRTVNLSETCRVLYQNKFEKWVHLVGFYYKNITRCTVLWMSNLTTRYLENLWVLVYMDCSCSKWTWRPVRCARQHKKCISEITFLFS